MPNCVLTCNMRNEFVAVKVYQAVKNPATTDEFAAEQMSLPLHTRINNAHASGGGAFRTHLYS